jgi:hypothetical protein
MPPRKKKSKAAKGKKPAAGKGDANKAADNAAVVGQQKQGTLDSDMQRLTVVDQQAVEDDALLLEEAIMLAAVEKQKIKVKEKENCTHGYTNPSSIFQARFCEDFLKTFTESFHNASTRGNSQSDRLKSALDAWRAAVAKSIRSTSLSKNVSNTERVNPFCLAEGTKLILDGKSDAARLPALVALVSKSAEADGWPDHQKMFELLDGDEHTLVQFFRKQIPCSCLDEKYKEVKSITKMGICFNNDCPLPGNMIRSKMLQCTGCTNGHNVSYCSREWQEAHWPKHKIICGKTAQEIEALRYMAKCMVGDVQV